MTNSRARGYLLTIFILGFVFQAVVVIFVYLKSSISYRDLQNLLTQLLTVYSVQVAVMLGGIFGARKHSITSSQAPIQAFAVAVVLAMIWNIMLAWRFVAFAYAAVNISVDDNATSVSSYVDQIANVSSFLVAGALSYFFAGKS